MLGESGRSVGTLLRDWRRRRGSSQLDLSAQTGVSTRHISFVETGRARPSVEMIVRLAEELDVPLRERNQLLLAGGYAPVYPERDLDAPELARVRAALSHLLAAQSPNPALVVDRWWTLVEANRPATRLVELCAAPLREPPINVCRLMLHRDGLAPHVENLGQWRAHLIGQVERRARRIDDRRLHELADELRAYPGHDGPEPPAGTVLLPLRLHLGHDHLAFFSVVAAVETAADVTVQELAVETFYPADDVTSSWVARALA